MRTLTKDLLTFVFLICTSLVLLPVTTEYAYAANEKGPRCSDGIDNDGDGLIDGDDPDCGGDGGNLEARVAELEALVAASDRAHSAKKFTDWSWLGEEGGTYWYVPEKYLPTILWMTTDPESYTSISDQTVWHINKFEDG